jgi:hypothetical protein
MPHDRTADCLYNSEAMLRLVANELATLHGQDTPRRAPHAEFVMESAPATMAPATGTSGADRSEAPSPS